MILTYDNFATIVAAVEGDHPDRMTSNHDSCHTVDL
jgi:hypothetical protein